MNPVVPLNATQLAKAQRSTYGVQSLGQWYPAANAYDYLPIMSFFGRSQRRGILLRLANSHRRATTIFTINDNLTKVWGKHTIKAGLTITRSRHGKAIRVITSREILLLART